MSVNRFFVYMVKPIEASYNLKLIGPTCRNVALRARVQLLLLIKIMLGAWPYNPTSTFSQSRGRISSQQTFSVVDL